MKLISNSIFIMFCLIHVSSIRAFQPLIYISIIFLCFIINNNELKLDKNIFNYLLIAFLPFFLTPNPTHLIYIFSMTLWALFSFKIIENVSCKHIVFIIIAFSIFPIYSNSGALESLWGNNIFLGSINLYAFHLVKTNRFSNKHFFYIILITLIFLSSSRSAYLAFLIYIAGSIIKSDKLIRTFSFSALIIIPITLYFFSQNLFLESLYEIYNLNFNNRSAFDLGNRLDVWKISPDYILKNPIGTGFSSSPAILQNHYNINISSTHSTTLKLLFEIGVLGYLYFLYIFKSLVLRLKGPNLVFLSVIIFKMNFDIINPFGLGLYGFIIYQLFYESKKNHENRLV